MQFNDYMTYIHQSRYARWNDAKGRRETWEETVGRFVDFWTSRYSDTFPSATIRDSLLDLSVVPSMRAIMTAGPALERDNVAGYNCSFVAIDHPRCFDEIMYILMCGTGVGFSVEEKDVRQLPTISDEFHETSTTIVVPDSRVGWASSFRELISLLYSGRIAKWDVSKIRPAGARLKTFGGRASGPAPLVDLFQFSVNLFRKAAGRKLTTLEAHDLVCKIADIVVVGGVRRSALISLSDLGDGAMRSAKNGAWWETNVQRALANNSAVYNGKPDFNTFLEEWKSLYESKSGERGIFNRMAAREQAASSGRRSIDGWDFGTNPCGEIILRPMGFCNLTEVILRPNDDFETIKKKVEIATILGTFQSTLTDFRYLRKGWQKNAEEERLLGVSFTGIYDHPIMSNDSFQLDDWLEAFKQHAINVNREWAGRLGIPVSAAITCVKPSGTVSQLAGCASGIHPSFSRYYVRNVRNDIKDPLCQFLIDQGVPHEPDVTKPDHMMVFSFPVEAPETTITKEEVNAIDQLELYETYRTKWCEHNPSITVYYDDDEFLGVGDWVYRNFNDIGGVSFLPRTDHVYQQAPYIAITEDEYNQRSRAFPNIDWSKLMAYETENLGLGGYHELACTGGVCEL